MSTLCSHPHSHGSQVKRLFAWYSSLDETDPKRVTWEGVRYRPATLGSAEFALMLLNFEVRTRGLTADDGRKCIKAHKPNHLVAEEDFKTRSKEAT